MSIDRLRAHYGFSRMPFGKDLAPGMLHAHGAHAEAVARISWCIAEQAIGVVSGECGAGKTVAARAAVAGLDASRHTVLYLGTPGVGLRGIYGLIITSLGGTPRFHHAALIPQAQEMLAAETAERGKHVVLIIDLCRGRDYADGRQDRCRRSRRRRRSRSRGRTACRHSHRLSRKARRLSSGR
jgi:type II secretory pathway predicted ATPase ExeA